MKIAILFLISVLFTSLIVVLFIAVLTVVKMLKEPIEDSYGSFDDLSKKEQEKYNN